MTQRGISFLEMLVVVAIITLLAGAMFVLDYRGYSASRTSADAAATLAEDLALLERTAQNSLPNQGSSLVIVSTDPLAYRCYRGRPSSVDPNSALGALLIERRFPQVALTGGPIDTSTPLLFAGNGSAQYVSSGVLADQHTTIALVLTARPGGRISKVELNLFTGAISQL